MYFDNESEQFYTVLQQDTRYFEDFRRDYLYQVSEWRC